MARRRRRSVGAAVSAAALAAAAESALALLALRPAGWRQVWTDPRWRWGPCDLAGA